MTIHTCCLWNIITSEPQSYAAILAVKTKKLSKMLNQKGLKEGVSRICQGFCESTSLHGYNYLNSANSIFLKFFWFLVILVMTSCGIVLLVQNTIEYLNSNIVTTIESSNSDLKVSIKLRYLFINNLHTSIVMSIYGHGGIVNSN